MGAGFERLREGIGVKEEEGKSGEESWWLHDGDGVWMEMGMGTGTGTGTGTGMGMGMGRRRCQEGDI